MSLHRVWEMMVWVAPYVLTAYVCLIAVLVVLLALKGETDRRHHA